MTEYGRFNTDQKALTKRIKAHDKYSLYDLNKWIFDQMSIEEGHSVLDLGCGTGKQTIPMAQLVGDKGHILALDVSQESLLILSKRASNLKINKRISYLHCELDDLQKHLHQETFDRVLSSYSIYYAQDPLKVIEVIHQALKPGGIFFFCGPAKDNNLELRRFHYALLKQPVPAEETGTFMEEISPKMTRAFFGNIEIVRFQNPLHFDSPEALYNYWSSYNLYKEKLDATFKARAKKHFQTHPTFETIKRVIGVKATR